MGAMGIWRLIIDLRWEQSAKILHPTTTHAKGIHSPVVVKGKKKDAPAAIWLRGKTRRVGKNHRNLPSDPPPEPRLRFRKVWAPGRPRTGLIRLETDGASEKNGGSESF